jgi:hypothetical protein
VQGPSGSLAIRSRIVSAFGIAFMAGALVTFGGACVLGGLVGLTGLDDGWRHGVAAAALVVLAVVDVSAIRRAAYCPLGWRRQTPKGFARRHSPTTTAAVWGLDSGLAVTTFRVAAVTWGAILLVAFGLVPWWVGIAYGAGFVIPLSILVCTHRVGRVASSPDPADSGLEAMLGRRSTVQGVSAGLLAAGAILLLASTP